MQKVVETTSKESYYDSHTSSLSALLTCGESTRTHLYDERTRETTYSYFFAFCRASSAFFIYDLALSLALFAFLTNDLARSVASFALR